MHKFKLDARINNQITLTRMEIIPPKAKRYEIPCIPSLSQDEINSLIERDAGNRGLAVRKRFYDPKVRAIPLVSTRGIDKDSAPYLDLIEGFQQHLKPKGNSRSQKRGYGETPRIRNFSASGGQALRECGAAVDILCDGDVSKCRVITLTLPASGHDAYKCLSDYSAEATNRLLQIIRRKKDERFHYFYVLEHQKRGALHWHICLYHEDKEASSRVGAELVSKWRDILRDIGAKGGVDLLYARGFGRQIESHEMQSINQEMYAGCAAYFAKYAGKTVYARNGSREKSITEINAEKYPVSSFWGRSRNLVKLCRSYSLSREYVGLPEEVEWKYQEAIELLSHYSLVQIEEVPFDVVVNVPFVGKKTISNGTRTVIYSKPEDYPVILGILRNTFDSMPKTVIRERM